MKSDTSRGGFTLIELLIVTVVIATLMGIVFRLAGAGSDNRKRAVTIDRMQRIENALSGYYAAYGSYPPVPLQGRSRSVLKKVSNGIQEPGKDETGHSFGSAADADKAWDLAGAQILAACKAQPVAVYFPFNDKDDDVRESVQELSAHLGENFDVIRNVGGMNTDSDRWDQFPVFQFGLLSFLLPRYLFMLEGDPDLYDVVNSRTKRRCGQWNANNQLPCKMDSGEQYRSWREVQDTIGAHRSGAKQSSSDKAGASTIAHLASQSVCARWMPNFEGIVSGGRTFYGVKTEDADSPYLTTSTTKEMGIFPHKGYQEGSGGGQRFILDGMTIRDGWGREFYYYSEPPFKSYRLWSAGADGKTFPVWYDRAKLNDKELKYVRQWTEDDISGLNN